jgi:hypothetical protein
MWYSVCIPPLCYLPEMSDLPMCLPGKESQQPHSGGGVLKKDLQPSLKHTPEMYILKIILENYNMEMELKFPRMG